MIIVCSLIGIVIILVAARLNYLSTPTKGSSIGTYNAPKEALLVIDIQKDTTKLPQYKHTDELLTNINTAITQAERSGMDIIYIRQEFTNPLDLILSSGQYKAGSPGANFSEELNLASDHIFTKLRSDTFSNSDFSQYLIDHEIDTLYLVGADASACVYKTALGAVDRGYETIILEDCIFSFSAKMRTKMLNQYEKDQIQTISLDSFLQATE